MIKRKRPKRPKIDTKSEAYLAGVKAGEAIDLDTLRAQARIVATMKDDATRH